MFTVSVRRDSKGKWEAVISGSRADSRAFFDLMAKVSALIDASDVTEPPEKRSARTLRELRADWSGTPTTGGMTPPGDSKTIVKMSKDKMVMDGVKSKKLAGYVTVAEAAEVYGVHVSTIYNWIAADRVEYVTVKANGGSAWDRQRMVKLGANPRRSGGRRRLVKKEKK